ncbi:MAG: tetratricopeptide repeat protein [Pirellulales bacterium]
MDERRGGSVHLGGGMGQAYDDLGFPIPTEFEVPGAGPSRSQRWGGRGPRRASRAKRWGVLLVALGVLLPAVIVPEVMPFARAAVVRWSLERAFACEAQGDLVGAVRELDRAIVWHGDDASLLAARAMLRLESGDPAGAREDADLGVANAPDQLDSYRVRAIVHVVAGRADDALADVAKVVALAGGDNAEAVNLRAYVRGLVGREISEALDDIDRVLEAMPSPPPEFLDTRGFLRHLAGRSDDALSDLELAIDLTRQRREQIMFLGRSLDPLELLQRMRSLDHALAVMLHHRGLVLETQGQLQQAAADFELARRKGFAPERGIL